MPSHSMAKQGQGTAALFLALALGSWQGAPGRQVKWSVLGQLLGERGHLPADRPTLPFSPVRVPLGLWGARVDIHFLLGGLVLSPVSTHSRAFSADVTKNTCGLCPLMLCNPLWNLLTGSGCRGLEHLAFPSLAHWPRGKTVPPSPEPGPRVDAACRVQQYHEPVQGEPCRLAGIAVSSKGLGPPPPPQSPTPQGLAHHPGAPAVVGPTSFLPMRPTLAARS